MWDTPQCMCDCVCEGTKRKHRGGRDGGGEREREQWGVQHLNCLFISSHCINYTHTAYKRVHWVCLCVCRRWGWNRETIKNDRYGNFCAVVCSLWLHVPQKKHTGRKGKTDIFFCSFTREKEAEQTQTVFWLWSVWQSVILCIKRARLSVCVEAAAWVCP